MRFGYKHIAVSLLAFCATNSSAITLDWDAVTWPAGSLSRSFDIDPAKAGNDITVAVSGSTGSLAPSLVNTSVMTPTIAPAFDGGPTPVGNSLELAVDLANRNQAITVTISFSSLYTSPGVSGVSFTIFDIDKQATANSNFEDQISGIYATLADGTKVAPTITGLGSSVALSGTGLTQILTGTANAVDTGIGSNAGNATISFLTDNIRSITFVYGSGSGAQGNPTYQHIGISDITYSPVPEINPAWSAVVSCLSAIGLILRHRASSRR